MWYVRKIEEADEDSIKAKMMSAWMDNYMDALREMDENSYVHEV